LDLILDGSTDSSGLYLHFTERPMDKTAGVLLLGTGGFIASHKEEHMETHCQLREQKTIYPFAFRTHTHKLGRYFQPTVKYFIEEHIISN